MHVLTAGGLCGAAYSVMDFACTGLAAHLKNKFTKITSSEVPFHSIVNTYLIFFYSLSSELPLSCFQTGVLSFCYVFVYLERFPQAWQCAPWLLMVLHMYAICS